jgi:hypothetical protein
VNRILLLIIIGGGLFLVILFISRPDLWKDFWLWIVGLAGPIMKVIDLLYRKAKQLVTRTTSNESADFVADQSVKNGQNEQ